jgi:hypothetical protein
MSGLSSVNDSLLDGNVSFSFDVVDPEIMPDPVVSAEEGESQSGVEVGPWTSGSFS